MASSKPKFVNVGGIRIRAGKTHQQVADQLNRIGDYYANRLDNEMHKPSAGPMSDHFYTANDKIRMLAGFGYNQGQDVTDRLRNGDDNKDYTTRFVYGSRASDAGYTHFNANNPNATYGAKGSSNG